MKHYRVIGLGFAAALVLAFGGQSMLGGRSRVRPPASPPVRLTRCASARLARRPCPGGCPIWRSTRRTRPSTTWARPTAASGRPPTTARHSRPRCRTPATWPSATSRCRSRIRTSSGWAPVRANNRQSTSWGDGVYKSTDGGKTYVNMGLRTSRHVNRILIDPRDNNTVFVAAGGSLWGPGGERGVYKTSDAGRTWRQVLKVDDDTGASELVMDPSNNKVLYASTYQRRRAACCMNGGGPGSGIWKSTDGGETWTRLKGNGLPDGPLGRIALDVYRRRPSVLYALIEGPAAAAGGRGAASGAEEGPGAAAQAGGGRAAAPAGGGRAAAQAGVSAAATGLYRSDDAGATWRKVNNVNPRPMYFSQVCIDPNDPEVVYLGGVGLHQSLDGGKTVATDVAASTHDDVHAIWVNPADSNHVLIGNDGGVAVLVRHGEEVGVPAEPASRHLLPRELRHGDAVQRVRRPAGQLQLVRAEPGARQRRHRELPLVDAAGRRRLRRAPGSDRLPHRLHRIAGRQHGAGRSRHVRDDDDPAAAGTGRAGAALELGHAARHVPARSEGDLHGRSEGVALTGSRPVLVGDQRRPHHRREPQ